jgi:hypothetical protein
MAPQPRLEMESPWVLKQPIARQLMTFMLLDWQRVE